MKLIESTFNNFRCFKQYSLLYGLETTIFIGKNGAGKSSVLSGIRKGLSFMFAKSKNYSLNLALTNNQKIEPFEILDANYDSIKRQYNYPIGNTFKALYQNNFIQWQLFKESSNGGLHPTLYGDALNIILEYFNNKNHFQLPVLCFISDSFPHEESNFGTKIRTIMNQETQFPRISLIMAGMNAPQMLTSGYIDYLKYPTLTKVLKAILKTLKNKFQCMKIIKIILKTKYLKLKS